ncbi:MAG: hypothetical protein HQ581_02235, partial [Planctomycetes bacterium]|nr:hypothetical protein [Planctomycetota bacterium]
YLMRLEIRIRGKEATGEMVTTDGFYRGPLPAGQIDDLAWQLSYGFQSKQESKAEDGMLRGGGPLGGGYGRDFRTQVVELISRDPAKPCHLRTEAWIRSHCALDDTWDIVEQFAHTRFSEEIEELAREKLTLPEPTAEMHRELVGRLRRIEVRNMVVNENESEPPEFSVNLLSLETYGRHDLPSIEARLYSRLAVYWRVKEALPELERLELSGVTRLRIVTAHDPAELLKAMIVARSEKEEENALFGPRTRRKEIDRFDWATEYACQLPPPKGADILLYALSRVGPGDQHSILYPLARCQLNAKQLATLDEYYKQAKSRATRIVAADCLLNQTHRDEYYRFLLELSLKWDEDDESYDPLGLPTHYVARDVLSYSLKHGKKRHETAEMVRTMLGRIRMDAPSTRNSVCTLIVALGDLGGTNDVELLLKYYEQSPDPIESEWNSITSDAIIAIAKIDAKLGLEKAHVEIQRYLDQETELVSFGDCVHPYLGLIFWQDDRSALKLLEPALAQRRREEQELRAKRGNTPWDWNPELLGDAEALVPYLKAKTVQQRLKHALPFPNREYIYFQGCRDMDQWSKDVGLRLIRQGADPKQCEPLLELEKHRPPMPSSREAESWVAEYAQ